MHKSIPFAVVALLLIASPLIMYGNSNSFILKNALAVDDGSNTDKITIKSDGSEKQDTSATQEDSDSDDSSKDKDSDSDDSSKDKDSDSDDSSKDKDSDSDDSSKDKDSDSDDSSKDEANVKSPEVQNAATNIQNVNCEEGAQYWALALKFLSEEQDIT